MRNRALKNCLMGALCLLPIAVFSLCGLYYLPVVGTFWHQNFAANGVAQIEPAAQMEAMYGDCRHFVTYGQNNASRWNSVAYFDGRYELTMQVPVRIWSSTSGEMTGQPRFFLNEVSDVAKLPSGQLSVSYSQSLEFGPAEWKKVVAAKGDFGAIHFKTKTGGVKNFDAYANSSR